MLTLKESLFSSILALYASTFLWFCLQWHSTLLRCRKNVFIVTFQSSERLLIDIYITHICFRLLFYSDSDFILRIFSLFLLLLPSQNVTSPWTTIKLRRTYKIHIFITYYFFLKTLGSEAFCFFHLWGNSQYFIECFGGSRISSLRLWPF